MSHDPLSHRLCDLEPRVANDRERIGNDRERVITTQIPPTGIDAVRDSFRRLDPAAYPELVGLSRNDAYGHGDTMAPGGLYLAAIMSRSLDPEPGQLVLDIGCGRGDSSIYLAEQCGAQVVCFDLWVGASWLGRKMKRRARGRDVLPMDRDARELLPFPDDYFDALFCMQSLHSFGTTAGVLRSLLHHLKPGGRFVVGGTCFDEEPEAGRLPAVFTRTQGWDAEYNSYHSPGWWKALFEETRLVDVSESRKLAGGLIMWEDEVLYHGERAGWTEEWLQDSRWLIDQITYSRERSPGLTHYVLTARKKDWSK
ncbi:MAG: class I SAM-dependent methyltransferase [Gemmatimonadota bacterium]|nr:class I SAM-dependent methyltransferase [Gemmatimonadota bacterium]